MSEENNGSEVVLVVEDDAFLGRVISEQLRQAHINAVQFTSAEVALEAAKKKQPDLIVLDIFLPGMNGLDMLAELRKDEQTKNIKVLVVSNTDDTKDRDRAKELGASFMIKGATSPDEIVAAVKANLAI